MASGLLQQLLSFLILFPLVSPRDLPLKLDVKSALDSRMANVYLELSRADPHTYPYTVAYGACDVPIFEDGPLTTSRRYSKWG